MSSYRQKLGKDERHEIDKLKYNVIDQISNEQCDDLKQRRET